jgi:hypothetical protein
VYWKHHIRVCFKLKRLKYIRRQGQLASNVKQILAESKLWEQTICPLHLSSGQFFFNLKNFLVIEICLIFVCRTWSQAQRAYPATHQHNWQAYLRQKLAHQQLKQQLTIYACSYHHKWTHLSATLYRTRNTTTKLK